MRIGVIGTIVKDHIYLANGKEVNSYGGIFYTLSILGNLLNETDEIYPVCALGANIHDEIFRKLSKYKNIKTTGIKKIEQNNAAVKLVYKDLYNRDEFLTNLMPEINLDHTKMVGPVDIWLVNFITGYEMSLETFNEFCKQKSGLIYMDFHSLSLDIDHDGRRILRKLPNWENWIHGVDVLQMNDAEARTLNGHPDFSVTDLIRFGKEVMKKNINAFHITCGSKGSLLFHNNNQNIEGSEIPAFEVDEVIDVTGCGDAFAAGFLVDYFEKKNVVAATRFANAIAGVNCTIRGTEELYKLKKFLSHGRNK